MPRKLRCVDLRMITMTWIALGATSLLLVACPGRGSSELRELLVDPQHARLGRTLNIDLIASRTKPGSATVLVGAKEARLTGQVDLDDSSVRYVFNYTVAADDPEGPVTVVGSALDRKGNEITIETTVVFDFTAPEITGLEGPGDPTNETTAAFTFGCSEDDCLFRCHLDGFLQREVSAESECQSGVRYDGLEDDEYTFTLIATDPAGNESSPVQWKWTVDTETPTAIIVSGPAELTESTSAAFELDCSKDDCEFTCALSGADQGEIGAASSCESGVTYHPLEDDDYTFAVTAKDPAGNESDPATWSWSVDTQDPIVSIVSKPSSSTNSTTVIFEVECVEDAV